MLHKGWVVSSLNCQYLYKKQMKNKILTDLIVFEDIGHHHSKNRVQSL